jgi:hypothetical protein
MKKQILLAGALCWNLLAHAETIHVQSVRYAGPYEIQKPFMIDSVDVNAQPFSINKVLQTVLNPDLLWNAQSIKGEVLPPFFRSIRSTSNRIRHRKHRLYYRPNTSKRVEKLSDVC